MEIGRFIRDATLFMGAGATTLTAACNPHQRAEVVDPAIRPIVSPGAQPPNGLRNQLICGPEAIGQIEYWGGMQGQEGKSLFDIAQGMAQNHIDNSDDPEREHARIRGFGWIILPSGGSISYAELESMTEEDPGAIPTTDSNQMYQLHVLECRYSFPSPMPSP